MKRGTTEHPKLLDLCSSLGLHKYEAVGILETLWHFTAKFAPQGDIGKYSDAAIAKAVGWERPTGTKGVTPECRLSDALVTAGWLDRDSVHRLIVHDWDEHSDQTLRRFLASRKLAFVKHETSTKLADASLPLPIPEPIPLPIPPTPTALDPVKEALLRIAGEIQSRHPPIHRDLGREGVYGKLMAIMKYKKVRKPNWEAEGEKINKNHKGACASYEWSKEDGQYAKGLTNWLAPTMGRYELSNTASDTLFPKQSGMNMNRHDLYES